MFTLPLAPVTPAWSADRLFQVLGACGNANAQYSGNRKHGSTQLSSNQSDGVAGFVIERLEGKSISELQNVDVDFEPPATAGVSTFILRVLVAGPNGDRVQRFTIGPDSDPDLPNLPTANWIQTAMFF
jgi:hypothetical protein